MVSTVTVIDHDVSVTVTRDSELAQDVPSHVTPLLYPSAGILLKPTQI
jgi:hypothetical protein